MPIRFIRAGAICGAIFGTLFGLAVVLFADCSGPDCTKERVLGVLMHAGIGLGAGAVLGLVLGLAWKGLSRRYFKSTRRRANVDPGASKRTM